MFILNCLVPACTEHPVDVTKSTYTIRVSIAFDLNDYLKLFGLINEAISFEMYSAYSLGTGWLINLSHENNKTRSDCASDKSYWKNHHIGVFVHMHVSVQNDEFIST